KAVRPSSVMGATKRVAELILQAYAANPANKTVFTMVRFGNVLDSSGSVVRLFKKQVQRGGPVTVTDPEMTRYFMSIREAAELVIQAGAMAEGGEVFVLDMGEPVKIMDLARSMITFMGHEVQEPGNPQGDIKIEICGLLPGEKIHEELLIGGDVRPTLHRRIMRSIEPSQPWRELEAKLAALEAACHANDTRV
ncbi:MAG: polysaccharide biosynthesis protein, partial [Ottowia sp.]|nr:polysaccharide biosynthesis protein [Ottowia sp.]